MPGEVFTEITVSISNYIWLFVLWNCNSSTLSYLIIHSGFSELLGSTLCFGMYLNPKSNTYFNFLFLNNTYELWIFYMDKLLAYSEWRMHHLFGVVAINTVIHYVLLLIFTCLLYVSPYRPTKHTEVESSH